MEQQQEQEKAKPQPRPQVPRLAGVLTSQEVRVAAVAAVAGLLALLNVPAERREIWTAFIVGLFGLAAAVVIALGYARGKLYEGTVPPGWRGVYDAGGVVDERGVELVGPERAAAVAAALEQLRRDDPAGYEAAVRAVAGDAAADKGLQQTNKSSGGPAAGGTLACVLGLLLPLLCGGCITTSPAFQKGAGAAGPLLAAELKEYGEARGVADAVRGERLEAAEALAIACAGRPQYDAVAAAWARARPVYTAAVAADGRLTEVDRQVIARTVREMDALLAAERARLGRWRPAP